MTSAFGSRGSARNFLAAGFGISLLAAVFPPASPASAQKQGGSLTFGLELDIPGFDPLKVGVFDTSAETAAAAIFDTMTTLDDKGEAAPKLALSWTHSDDFRTWTFKLRPGVKFQDGTPFNAQAVKENFDRQKFVLRPPSRGSDCLPLRRVPLSRRCGGYPGAPRNRISAHCRRWWFPGCRTSRRSSCGSG